VSEGCATSEQEPVTTAVQAARTSACPHPEAVGKRWGDPISAERQKELKYYFDEWKNEQDVRKKQPPYLGTTLTGADIAWLSENVREKPGGLHLEGANARDAHLEGADLSDAHLENSFFVAAHLEGASLSGAHLEQSIAYGVKLDGADLWNAHLDGADLTDGYLRGALLSRCLGNAAQGSPC
jgi:Pentapeptide repeats (8 copies)